MNVLAITQARTGSSRLPGKVLKQVNGQTLLEIHLERLSKSKRIDKLLVATTTNAEDEAIFSLVTELGFSCYRGSSDNVLDRFYQAARDQKSKWIVRLTSDCPLIDAEVVDSVIDMAIAEDLDYCSNALEHTFPNGMDVEVFKFSALEKAWHEATLNSDKEHVTPYIYRNSTHFNESLFVAKSYTTSKNYGHVRLTIDEQEDFEVVKIIIEKLGVEKDWKTYADYYLAHKEINSINNHIDRNEGYLKSLNNDTPNDN